jgi:hypothetical protein
MTYVNLALSTVLGITLVATLTIGFRLGWDALERAIARGEVGIVDQPSHVRLISARPDPCPRCRSVACHCLSRLDQMDGLR